MFETTKDEGPGGIFSARYQDPEIDADIDQALRAFVTKRESKIPTDIR